MQDWGNSVIKTGKLHKPYRRKSGNLDRAQKADVKGLTLTLSIDPQLVTTKGGENYGVFQHDGTPGGQIKGYPWMEIEANKRAGELADKIAEDIIEVFL